MAACRAMPASQRFCNCSSRVLNTFVSLASLSIRTSTQTRSVYSYASPSTFPRSFSTSRTHHLELQHKDDDQFNAEQAMGELAEEKSETSKDPSKIPGNLDNPIPWYLQLQPPIRSTNPLFERQRLPDLPDDPPALLQPILEHLSIEVGLDDLTLLDIRKLDPPPALGANLLMIVGTARSEKHLHVSADRFSRWLRTVHKLSPYADGLLGRNELKLKIRRKARRAKLLSSVGSTESGNADDGIRTGWVCVNIGSIEPAKEALQQADEASDGFVGFGGQTDGVKLVIQMLTEEKREELDLETLWGGFLARQQRKQIREAEKVIQEAREHEVGYSSTDTYRNVADTASFTVCSRTSNHNRAYHTSARLHSTTTTIESSTSDYDGLDEQSLEPRLNLPEFTEADLTPCSTTGLSTAFDRSAQNLILESHIKYLKTLPRGTAIEVLGTGAADFDSTTFLSSFYKHFPLFPETDHWQCRLDLFHYAFELQHPGYWKSDIFVLIREIQNSGLEVSLENYHRAVSALLKPDRKGMELKFDRPTISMIDFLRCVDLISDMTLDAHNVFNEITISPLLKALPRVRPDFEETTVLNSDAVFQVLRVLDQRSVYLIRTSSHYHIMVAFLDSGDWDGFWEYWHGIAKRIQRKSFLLYALMFKAITRTDHQANCITALRTWVPEMEMEYPPVPLSGILARTVMDCLRVADPEVETHIQSGANANGQHVRLWHRCLQGRSGSDEISREEEADELLQHFKAYLYHLE